MCPHCHSDNLKIRKLRGFERIAVLLTGKRRYTCIECNKHFRALDRRTTNRGGDALNAARAAGVLKQ
jgi:transposase-like protein